MNNDFFAALQKLELMAFFSGYPLIYAIVSVFAGSALLKEKFGGQAMRLLPFAYALVGTLFLSFQLKKLFPDYSIGHIKLIIQQPYLVIWGLLAILFWIPAISKKTIISLIHSFVFFFFLVSDLFQQLTSSQADNNMVMNDMKVYGNSLMLNLGAFAVLITLSSLFTSLKKR